MAGEILQGLNLDQGRETMLMGPNGAGKSTPGERSWATGI